MRNLRERVFDTPDGPLSSVQWENARPVETIRDTAKTVRAYRAVVGTTATTEVLSPCGHEVPRFDQTQAFTIMTSQGVPLRYPRSRLCPACHNHPTHASLKRVTGQLQLVSDWGHMTKPERGTAEILLRPLLNIEHSELTFADWNNMTPVQRGELAERAEEFTQVFGLTFREFLSLKLEPVAPITPAGLKRLQASPAEKKARREKAEERAFKKDWERQRR